MDTTYQTANKFGGANNSNIFIEEFVSSGSVNNVLSDNEFNEEMNDNNNINPHNYCSSPEETPPIVKKRKNMMWKITFVGVVVNSLIEQSR